MSTRIRYIILMTLLAASAWGQRSASLSGTVSDASGAVIPEAKVRVTNEATSEVLETTSNQAGTYVVPALNPGSYALNVQAQGFKVFSHPGITLITGTATRVDATMELGNVSEAVVVTAQAPLLSSESSSVATTVQQSTIANMPLAGRRAAQLARLSGFVVQKGTGSSVTVAGGRSNNNMWVLDGGTVNNVSLGIPTLMFDPPIDSLEEFTVNVSNYSAELGRTGGGYIQMTTKSGSNAFHGSAFDFLRNDALDARNFFAAGKPKLRRNQFGASLGGPVVHDKLFFFVNYEGTRQSSEATQIRNVPGMLERTGDFSVEGTTNIKDPLTGQPFPNRIIPQTRLDPVGKQIALLYAAPNVAGRPVRNSNYRANEPVTDNTDVFVSRVDYNLRDSDKVFVRVVGNLHQNYNLPTFPVPGVDDTNWQIEESFFSVMPTWFHNFSPHVLSETRFSWVRRAQHTISGGTGLGWADKLGIKGTNPLYFPRVVVPGLATLGRDVHERIQLPIRTNMLVQSITVIHGNHTFKMGGEYQYGRNDDFNYTIAGGEFDFNSLATGDSLASLLLGWVQRTTRSEAMPLRSRSDSWGAYFQDDWRLSRSLTLNLGLRWDMDQPRWEAFDNRQSSFDRGLINPISRTPGAVVFSGRDGYSKYAHNFDKNNFGPRVGFAWRLNNRTVIRGGGGVVYAGQYDSATPTVANLGFSISGDFVSPDGGLTPAIVLANGIPAIPTPSADSLKPGWGAVPVGKAPTTSVEFFEPKGRATPYLFNFNFNIQHELGRNTMLELGYLSTLGHKLAGSNPESINMVPPNLRGPGNAQLLRPYPQYSDVTVVAPTIGNSNYHALNIGINKRQSGGLQFRGNYTWSKAIDDVSGRDEFGGAAGYSDYYDRRADRGLSGNHIAHRLVGSAVYELPLRRNPNWGSFSKVAGLAFAGWSLGVIGEARTGTAFGILEQSVGAANAFLKNLRSSAVGPYSDNPNFRDNVLSQPYFDRSVFVAPAPYTTGNLGRTVAIGPGGFSADLSVLKDFPVREGHRVQFRAELLNCLNHPSFANPNGTRGSASFGMITGLAPGQPARVVQLGLHYKF